MPTHLHGSARPNRLLATSATAVAVVLAGCTTSTPGTSGSSSTPPIAPGPPAVALPTGSAPSELDPADFTADITNPYWPMKPLTRWTYRERAEDGTVTEAVVVVTEHTRRMADGITARVVRDTVTQNGNLIEDTNDWYAQDSAGNVWYLGEDTAEFDGGKITSREGSFEAGVHGSQGGVIMPAEPHPGVHYRQEYYRGHAEDNGEVLSTGELVEVPVGRYRGCLLTRDTSTIEPTAWELKLYARDVGPVVTLGLSGDVGREELVRIDRARPGDGTGPLGRPNP